MMATKQAKAPVIRNNRRKSLLRGSGGAIQLKKAAIRKNSLKGLLSRHA